ncbi:MAG: lytic transglycosylase domain-containing protein [Vicinamibacterales bacterium]|nr:lytic transglycosylase domain-containing protein [Vicinamibacterales bacterium]
MTHRTIRNIGVALLVGAGLAVAAPASAELLFFSDTRSMSVVSHRFEGDRIIVTLRGGGEMSFDRSLVNQIGPDEVPYTEPDAQAATAIDATPALAEKTQFDPMIERASTEHGVPARLVKAVIQVESGFQSRARSSKGAMGLMQLMPRTAREYQAGRNPYDPARNIQAGTKYLRKLLDEFELPLALAAYNAGEGAVRRFGGIPPYAETQDYVRKIMALVGTSYQLR